MQAVVLAGGLATRLGQRAVRQPKYLLPVAGRPFAHWQLRRLADAGFDEVLLCIGHLGQQIREALGDGSALAATWGCGRQWKLTYTDDGPQALGTGGALRQALPLLRSTFLVTYGDSYLPFDYAAPLRDLCAHDEALATMSVFENLNHLEPSNAQVVGSHVVDFDKRASGFHHIDYGATALRRDAVATLPEGPCDLSRLQQQLAQRGVMRAYVADQRFYEIGSIAGLADLQLYLERAA